MGLDELVRKEISKLNIPAGFKGNITLNCDDGLVKKFKIEMTCELEQRRRFVAS